MSVKVERKRFRGAPFGTQTMRFDIAGMHPESKRPGTNTQILYSIKPGTEIGPGSYDVDYGSFDAKTIERAQEGPGWARQYAMERIAQLPYLLYKKQWQEKRLQIQRLGPGTYNMKDSLQGSATKPQSTRGIIDTLEPRFKDLKKLTTPGPGTYGEGGIPHSEIEKLRLKSNSTRGLLSSGKSSDRSLPNPGSDLGPGTYPFKSSVNEMLNKKFSVKRNIYDTFSGDRGKPIKTGHYAKGFVHGLVPGQYAFTSFTDDIVSKDNKHKGIFTKIEKSKKYPSERIFHCDLANNPRNPSDPSPAYYEPNRSYYEKHTPTSKGETPPFNVAAPRSDKISVRFFTGNFNPVGPGRYDVQRWNEKQHQQSACNSFNSTTSQPTIERTKVLRERLREKDVRTKEHLVKPLQNSYTNDYAESRCYTIA